MCPSDRSATPLFLSPLCWHSCCSTLKKWRLKPIHHVHRKSNRNSQRNDQVPEAAFNKCCDDGIRRRDLDRPRHSRGFRYDRSHRRRNESCYARLERQENKSWASRYTTMTRKNRRYRGSRSHTPTLGALRDHRRGQVPGNRQARGGDPHQPVEGGTGSILRAQSHPGTLSGRCPGLSSNNVYIEPTPSFPVCCLCSSLFGCARG